jgi:Cu-Zn family superoxide dismutase
MKHFIVSLALIIAALYAGSTYYYYSPLYPAITHASAVIYPTKGNTISGTATFTQEKDGLHIEAHIIGLTPGEHGFHIHEFGNCACDDAVCAGGHFNPTKDIHGSPESKHRHVGDLGNLVANEEGIAEYKLVDTDSTLNGPHSILGRGLIIHAQPDDYTTQPTGNAGARIGCGVVGIAKVPAQ